MKIGKKLLCIIVSTSVLVGITTGVFASGVARQITATLDPAISVVYNGSAQNLKDASGNDVYPIVYNGSTYLPVRAVSDVVGVDVKWDGATKTVILSDEGAGISSGTDEKPPTPVVNELDMAAAMTGNNRTWRITNADDLIVEGKTFSTGILRDIWNGTASTSKVNVAYIDVTGKTTVSFTGWSDVNAHLFLLDEELNTIESFYVDAGELKDIVVDVTNYDMVSFGANSDYGSVKGYAKFLNPIAK